MAIVYGICIGNDQKYEKYCAPFLRAAALPSNIDESRNNRSIFTAYNRLLDRARSRPDLEALVLLHEDLEIRSPGFEEQIQTLLRDDDVAIVGAIGGRGVNGVRWSQADERFGRMPDAFNGDNDFGGGIHDVDIVDGCLMVLSAWAVQNLRFDEETYEGFHAYDADICMQARLAGRRVIVAPIDAFHHTKGGFGDVARHQKSDEAFRQKWGIPQSPVRQRLARRYRFVGRIARLVGK